MLTLYISHDFCDVRLLKTREIARDDMIIADQIITIFTIN